MINRQHKLIIKAFLSSKIPQTIRQCAPQLILVDSTIAGYCNKLLNIKRNNKIKLMSNRIITEDEIRTFSKLINDCTGVQKEELIIYYRLIRLTESILCYYG